VSRTAALSFQTKSQQDKLMRKFNQWLVIAGIACVAGLGTNRALAQQQDRMAEFQQRRMDSLKEQMEVKDDTEWNAIKPLVQKVMDAQRTVMSDRMRGAIRGGGGGRGGQGGGGNNNNAADQGNGGRQRNRGGFGGEPSPEADALEKAVEAKASSAEMKAALAKYLDARKAKEAELTKAQDDLRKVLSVRQEAIATVNGLL
jgi:hypothetical protein